MKSVVFAVAIMAGIVFNANADQNVEGCKVFSAIARGVALSRDNDVPQAETAQRALNAVNTSERGKQYILKLVKMVYEDPAALKISPQDMARLAYAACIGD